MALTCGEEDAGAFNGAQWLAKNHRDWIDAEFALNEGAWGELDAKGRALVMNVQAGEGRAELPARGHERRAATVRDRARTTPHQLASALSASSL